MIKAVVEMTGNTDGGPASTFSTHAQRATGMVGISSHSTVIRSCVYKMFVRKHVRSTVRVIYFTTLLSPLLVPAHQL